MEDGGAIAEKREAGGDRQGRGLAEGDESHQEAGGFLAGAVHG
jgi:hypothetical protein